MGFMKFAPVFVLSLFAASQAHAVSGWERPVAKAEMKVISGDDSFASVREAQLVMTKREGGAAPTGFILLLNNQTLAFDVKSQGKTECGSEVYVATPEITATMIGVKTYRLQLVDHTHRTCRGGAHATWEASLIDVVRDGEEMMTLQGEPEPVYSIQQ